MAVDLSPLLACPACRSLLTRDGELIGCPACGASYEITDGTPILLPRGVRAPALDARWDPGVRRVIPPRLLALLEPYRDLLLPSLTYKSRSSREIVSRFVASLGPDAVILNVGSGRTDYGPQVANLEIEPGPGVDLVGVAEHLPIADGACAGVILMAVLEHVEDAHRTLGEARRVLRPDGVLLVDVPFIQGYHPSPGDYRRYTEPGLRAEVTRLGFTVEESGVAVGPGSAAAWVASEFLALLVSGRSARAYRVAKLVTTWLANPLKYADLWLEGHPMAYAIPSAVWVRARRHDH